MLFEKYQDKFKKVASEVISIDDRIDAIYTNDNVIILSQYQFEILFDYKSEYMTLRKKVLDDLKLNRIIFSLIPRVLRVCGALL
ncbi:DUF4868 domain-containing protein [Thalassobacillus sp. C254]|uniref:DUF4868 domain-containing protein n=1 Tax=Thalassobacillus sp. C254 TaxID=1225341 RepID=UPI0006D0B18D